MLGEELQPVVYQSLVPARCVRPVSRTLVVVSYLQEDTPVAQKVAPVASDLDTPILVVSVKALEDLMMGEAVTLLRVDALWRPGSMDYVIVLRGSTPLTDIRRGEVEASLGHQPRCRRQGPSREQYSY